MKRTLGIKPLVYPTPVFVVGDYYGVGAWLGKAFSAGDSIGQH